MDELIPAAWQAKVPAISLAHLSPPQRESLPAVFGSFLDAAGTAMGRATFYNTQEEQEQALDVLHSELFAVDRGIYAAALLLPGLTDYTRQLGAVRLLANRRTDGSVLSPQQEMMVLEYLINHLPPQRMFKTFELLREGRVNNARTRRLILRKILADKRLEQWAVKYRRKAARALEHAWGKRTASIVCSILAKDPAVRNDQEKHILARQISRHLDHEEALDRVGECVAFVFGCEDKLTLGRLKAYREAKTKLERGKNLPYEVLEGIRSQFHPDRTSAEVLELTKGQLTKAQKMAMQRKAIEAKVKVVFDPSRYDPVRLYVYAFEMGMTKAISKQLQIKAGESARQLPVHFGHVGILLDSSGSMLGHETQKLRPISVALAMRDMLSCAGDKATVVNTSGQPAPAFQLIEPSGETLLAPGLLELLHGQPEVVFVLTDGYENTTAGRFGEVVRTVREIGIETPIYQVTPVFAAEAQGLRVLSDAVLTMPLNKPEALCLGLLKAMFALDVQRAIGGLLGVTLPLVGISVKELMKSEEKP